MLGFKVWLTKDKIFSNALENYYIKHDGSLYFHPEYLTSKQLNQKVFIPLQCTGLKDCEGNEIYEGDILESIDLPKEDYRSLIHVKNAASFNRIVGEYVFVDREKLQVFFYKIIGNRFENPELLEKL
jgi:hypothetical protein